MTDKYIIVCQARTGSTLLSTALQQNPEIAENGEVFLRIYDYVLMFGLNWREEAPQIPLAYKLAEIRERDYLSFLYDWAFYAGRAKVAGFKFKYEELSLPVYQRLVDRVAADTSIAILHLIRDNLLERYLSQKRAVESWVFEASPDRAHLETKSYIITPQECENDFRRSQDLQASYRLMFKHHNLLEIRYEDLAGDFDRAMTSVQEFLGVKPVKIQKALRKIQQGPLRDRLTNCDELTAYFQGTPYIRFFET